MTWKKKTNNNLLLVIQLSDIANNSHDQIKVRSIPLVSPAITISLSCDHSMLAVNYIQNGSAFISIYSVKSFLANVSHLVDWLFQMRIFFIFILLFQNIVSIFENIVLSAELNVNASNLLWNPVIANTLAICLDNGSLSVLNFNEQGYELHTIDKVEQVQ